MIADILIYKKISSHFADDLEIKGAGLFGFRSRISDSLSKRGDRKQQAKK
jgi:hypothetical protein